MSFLDSLANQIASQYSIGENTNHTLNSIDPDTGKSEKYGSLGDFANQFDQSAERRYVENGYLRKDPYNTDPKLLEILLQEPSATIFVKKRMFSSVGENFRPDYMDEDEKLYYRSMKILFQNKCAQVAALEKLSKIQKITSGVGSVPEQIMPLIFTLTDTVRNGLDLGINPYPSAPSGTSAYDPGKLINIIDIVRKNYAFNQTNQFTTWITDSSNLFQSQLGEGTGVIEITNFTNLNTTVATKLEGGSFSFSIYDPYETMLITEYDIEKAISDATNDFYNNKIFQFGQQSSDKLINDLTVRLNDIRAKRGASSISFKIDPDTMLGKRVTAILDRPAIELLFDYDTSSALSGGFGGTNTTIAPEYLKGGDIAGNDGIDATNVVFSKVATNSNSTPGKFNGPDSELSIFNRLVSTIFSKITLDANSKNALFLMNDKTNYARRKLRFHFSGKLLIQPMDTVSIYINSKSRYDSKLTTGMESMFNGLGVLQNLDHAVTDLSNAVGALNPSGNIPLEIEKSAFVGKDFPNYLWSVMRSQFVSENEGTHVFAGVVKSAKDSWSDGKFTISINGADNSYYFEMGKINFKPSASAWNGTFYDPLTPFKSNFDSINSNTSTDVNDLLQYNKDLLSVGPNDPGYGLIKNRLGRFAGDFVNEKNIIQDRNYDPITGGTTKTFYAPDGLVYKWKEGIGSFVQYGSNMDMHDAVKTGNQSITVDPFAGQNIMNVLSLLISGVPYDYATYFKASSQADGQFDNSQTKENFAHSFIQSLRTDLSKSNALWGNFIPFKNLVMDEQSYINGINGVASLNAANVSLNNNIKKLQDLNNNIYISGLTFGIFDPSEASQAAQKLKNDAKQQIEFIKVANSEFASTYEKNKSNYTGVYQVGDDVSFDVDNSLDISSKTTSRNASRKFLRRELDFLTRRMSYNVRANQDKNLFIVDDFYDKDFDMLAFESDFSGSLQKLFNGTEDYLPVIDKIKTTAQLLDLEVFCDTQGHIRCRPKQYNRMPSSVFYKMMYLKKALNIQVMPSFINSLFNSKLDALKQKLEVIEDQIRLDCALVGKYTDNDCLKFILGNGVVNNLGSTFSFISDEKMGSIADIDTLLKAAHPDSINNSSETQAFDIIKSGATSTKNIFTTSDKYKAIINILSTSSEFLNSNAYNATREDEVSTRIYNKTGIAVNKQDYLLTNSIGTTSVFIPAGSKVDVFKVINELSSKISERQKALKLFYNTLKNAKEFKYLDDNANASSELITNGTYGNQNVPDVFEHMIEDETYDDYGLNSGKRFIIKRSQIISLDIEENPPEFNHIQVDGVLSPVSINSNINENAGNSFQGSGNSMISAIAIDYDMWRNYGFRHGQPIKAPFLSNPQTQCAPYASMILSRNRKEVLKGSCTIAGNEYSQPGEVVFLEDRQMLFYVTEVRHSFTYNSKFTTTLTLEYGHTPGDYIPTPTDIIGKLLNNNKDAGNLIVYRQGSSFPEESLGVLQLGPANAVKTDEEEDTSTDYSSDSDPNALTKENNRVINDIIYKSRQIIAKNQGTTGNVKGKIELRIFYNTKTNVKVNMALQKFAEEKKYILSGFNSAISSQNGKEPQSPINPNHIDIVHIDTSDRNERRSVSSAALNAARNNIEKTSYGNTDASNLGNQFNYVYNYIVDCFLVVEQTTDQGSNGA